MAQEERELFFSAWAMQNALHYWMFVLHLMTINPTACWDVSLKTKNVNLIVAREKKSGDHSRLDSSSGGSRMS